MLRVFSFSIDPHDTQTWIKIESKVCSLRRQQKFRSVIASITTLPRILVLLVLTPNTSLAAATLAVVVIENQRAELPDGHARPSTR